MSNRKQTQTDKVFDYMSSFGKITTMDAFVDLGITRLSARIWELRHDRGLSVFQKRTTRLNRFGETCTVMVYALKPFSAEVAK